ncbi:MAG: hypothetical protein M1833_004107 [Piccolia ochrophora]|nr:MAG: hypothetical protein M1833_004107 [Piccolia ochrophora]
MADVSPHHHMPGSFYPEAYLVDHALPPKLDVNVGPSSHLFRPPQTPSASSSLHLSSAALTSCPLESSSVAGRKRNRQNTSVDYLGDSASMISAARSVDPVSPLPFVSTRYTLAGGLDTPTGAVESAYERAEYGGAMSDLDYRRAWNGHRTFRMPERGSSYDQGYFGALPRGALSHERNGASRPNCTNGQSGWGTLVFNVVGGVAGKVWSFCKAGAFRGFHAGGGQGYEVTPTAEPMDDGEAWELTYESKRVDEDPFQASIMDSTVPPGDYIEDYIPLDQTPPRAAKRIQRGKGEGELRGHWILVSSSASASPYAHEEGSPLHRRPPRKTRPSLYRQSTYDSHGTRLLATPSPRFSASRASAANMSQPASASMHSQPCASFASPRRPTSASKPTSIPVSRAKTKSSYRPMSPKKDTRPRTPTSTKPPSTTTSPTPQQQHLLNKRRRAEREANANMARWNSQLKDLIREGKEALGARVVVDFEGDRGSDTEGDFVREVENEMTMDGEGWGRWNDG